MMADTKDRATRARELIREEVEGLERIHKAKYGDFPARPEDRDYRRGFVDGLRKAGDLLGEGDGR
jgi:hypothetical protein